MGAAAPPAITMTFGSLGSREKRGNNGKNEKGNIITSRLAVTKLAEFSTFLLRDLGQQQDYVTSLSPRLRSRVSPGDERESN